jgi:hypothetical protein
VPAAAVQIVGLRAMMRDLATMSDPIGGALLKAMREAGKEAVQPVADAVRNALPSKTGTLRGTVRVSSTRTGATLRVGRKTIPYAGPVDFGGYPGQREFLREGRYLYPTMQAHQAQVVREYEAAIGRAVDHFPWTNYTNDPKAVHD